jgi:hypothetical protein
MTSDKSVLTVRVDHDSPNHYVQVLYRDGHVEEDSVHLTRNQSQARAAALALLLNCNWEQN